MKNGKSWQKMVNQYMAIHVEVRNQIGDNFSELLRGAKKTRSQKKLRLLALLDRANNALNRYNRNIHKAGIFEVDAEGNTVNYDRDANIAIPREVYFQLNNRRTDYGKDNKERVSRAVHCFA